MSKLSDRHGGKQVRELKQQYSSHIYEVIGLEAPANLASRTGLGLSFE
jgi:hypothetical protein